MRSHLLVLLAGAMLPILLITAFVVRRLVDDNRSMVERRMLEASRASAAAVDAEIAGTIRTRHPTSFVVSTWNNRGVRLATAAVPPFMKNGFVVTCETTGDAIIIDPGDEADALIARVRESAATVKGILLTHAHLDHITGVGRAKVAFDVPVWLHRDDLFLYDAIVEQGVLFGMRVDRQPPVDAFYEPGVAFRFGAYVVDIRHTPGHCPGGVCLAIGRADTTDRELFVGDTLFAGSIGRTDLPGGDHATLLHSIRTTLFAFPDEAVVHPGHGPDTTIGRERRTNPFLA